MKKILVINGHPGSKSLSLELSKAYVSGAKKGGASVKELHLKDLTFDPVLHEGYKQRQELEPDLLNAQELIKWADHLVFFSPVWWSNVSSLLKGFVDRTFLPGFAFKFISKLRVKKYLKGKTARLVLTSGASCFIYRFVLRSPVESVFGRGVLRFCGVKMKCSVIVGDAEKMKENKKQSWLDKINKLGEKNK
jgi:NAD(P)H dehydrogenase (quinone)